MENFSIISNEKITASVATQIPPVATQVASVGTQAASEEIVRGQ